MDERIQQKSEISEHTIKDCIQQKSEISEHTIKDCIFCKITNGEIPSKKVYEDDNVYAFLDIMPVNKGHTLVIAKNHTESIEEASDEDLKNLILAVKKIAPAVVKAVNAIAYNVGVNNGKGAGQIVPHLHFHIMPRFEGDGLRLWEGKKLEDSEMDKIKDDIVSNV